MRYLLLLCLLIPVHCLAQLTLQGRVIDTVDHQPIPNASVFINNTTIGDKADTAGNFKLRNLKPGQYELVVSAIGYQAKRQVLLIKNNLNLPDIKLQTRILMAGEVTIAGKDPKREKKLRMFKEQFLGASDFGDRCKILNPQVLTLIFSEHDQVLTGHTTDFLEVENDALGYTVKYLLNNFVLDKIALTMRYEGFAFFEEKHGTTAEKEKWERNRREVYYGSPTHFLRAVLADKADFDFVVRPFCFRQMERVYKLGGQRILDPNSSDTTSYLMQRFDTLHVANYVYKTDRRGIYAIKYPENLDIFYYPPGVPHYINLNLEYGHRGQIGSFDFIDDQIFFDTNGTILNPTGALFRLKWGTTRIAELLPIDYWPPLREQSGRIITGKTHFDSYH